MARPPCTAPRDNLPGDRGCSDDNCPRHAYDQMEPDELEHVEWHNPHEGREQYTPDVSDAHFGAW